VTIIACRRARLIGPRQLCFETLDLNSADVGLNQVLAVTQFTAVSIGTEKAAWLGLPGLRLGPIYPRLVGYCNAARVVAVGETVRNLAPGDRILTHQSHQSGFICDASNVLAKIPDGLSSKTACATYIGHIALSALQRGRLFAEESVAVQGLGPIGLAAIALAKDAGAYPVVAIGNDPGRGALAASLGSDLQFDAAESDLDALVLKATSGEGAHLVVTTVNAWSAWRMSLAMVRPFGRIAVLGFPGRGEPAPTFNPLESATFYMRQPSILSAGQAFGSGPWGDGDAAANLRKNMSWLLGKIREGALPIDMLISHEFRWCDLAEVYERADDGDKTVVIAVLNWSSAT